MSLVSESLQVILTRQTSSCGLLYGEMYCLTASRVQLGGASNLQCCENIEALLGPYPDAALHNCLCLPGTFEALVAGSEGIGNQNVTEIFYGCAAREDFEFNTLFLDRCTNETVIIPEGYDPDLIAEQLGLGNVPLPPEEAFDEIQEQINQIIDSFRPPTPKP